MDAAAEIAPGLRQRHVAFVRARDAREAPIVGVRVVQLDRDGQEAVVEPTIVILEMAVHTAAAVQHATGKSLLDMGVDVDVIEPECGERFAVGICLA